MTLAFIYSSFFPHLAAAAESTDRSPRPTSAPAIAQNQVTEAPGAPVKKTQKEASKVEVKGEEEPPEPAEPEPTEAWKVCLRNLTSANTLSELQLFLEQPNLTDSQQSCFFLLFLKEIVSHQPLVYFCRI